MYMMRAYLNQGCTSRANALLVGTRAFFCFVLVVLILVVALAGGQDEEMVVLPHEGELRMLTAGSVLETILTGRPKSTTLPQARLYSEQLACLIRLTRVSVAASLCLRSPFVSPTRGEYETKAMLGPVSFFFLCLCLCLCCCFFRLCFFRQRERGAVVTNCCRLSPPRSSCLARWPKSRSSRGQWTSRVLLAVDAAAPRPELFPRHKPTSWCFCGRRGCRSRVSCKDRCHGC